MISRKALLIIDIQNDFCPGGALAVADADKIIYVVSQYIDIFERQRMPVFISRDWHHPESRHFKEFGGQWPVHCVQDTKGAEFHRSLKVPKGAIILSKGMGRDEDSYSDFESVDTGGVPFLTLLKRLDTNELFVGGIATDYCVKYSVLDALKFGFRVNLLTDAIKGVDLKPGDSEKAIEEMVDHGAKRMQMSSAKQAVLV